MRNGGALKRGLSSLACTAACGLLITACGGGDAPAPRQAVLPQGASLIPDAPAAQPTPTPTPGTPPPDDLLLPVFGSPQGISSDACGAPTPPPVARFSVHPLGGNGERVMLDSTPLVGPDVEYCRAVGFTDGRAFCAVRPEGHPERIACEAVLVGAASDTGRAGPTWSVDGRACDGTGQTASCINHPSNQYLVYAWGAGVFRACASNGACGQITLP